MGSIVCFLESFEVIFKPSPLKSQFSLFMGLFLSPNIFPGAMHKNEKTLRNYPGGSSIEINLNLVAIFFFSDGKRKTTKAGKSGERIPYLQLSKCRMGKTEDKYLVEEEEVSSSGGKAVRS